MYGLSWTTKKSNCPERCAAFVAREPQRMNIDIAALQETRVADEGQLSESGGGYTSFWKGKPSCNRRLYGVGLGVKNEVGNFPHGVNERLITLQLNLSGGRKVTVISAYAPTLRRTRRHSMLTWIALLSIPHSHKTAVGLIQCPNWKRPGDVRRGYWKRGGGEMQWQWIAVLLLTKCAENNLVITNTLFRQSQTSWRHPRSSHWLCHRQTEKQTRHTHDKGDKSRVLLLDWP